jgi:hypothetical protein
VAVKKFTEFVDIDGLLNHAFVTPGKGVTGHYYLHVLQGFRDAVWSKRCNKSQWFLQHENAPSHTSLIEHQFLVEKNIPVIFQPPY